METNLEVPVVRGEDFFEDIGVAVTAKNSLHGCRGASERLLGVCAAVEEAVSRTEGVLVSTSQGAVMCSERMWVYLCARVCVFGC